MQVECSITERFLKPKYLVFVFLIVHSYMFSMASFLLIDPICSKQIQIVRKCYHILYQKSSWIFCDTAPANVSVVNSSMMHFERGKKNTSYFLQPFCCCFHAQGTILESGSSFLCLFKILLNNSHAQKSWKSLDGCVIS